MSRRIGVLRRPIILKVKIFHFVLSISAFILSLPPNEYHVLAWLNKLSTAFTKIYRNLDLKKVASLKIETVKKQLDQVNAFHTAFKIPMQDAPIIPSPERCKLRFDLLQEELNEFKEAYEANDLVEVADALVDLQYILCGSVLEFGLQDKFQALFDEVQRSNMSKLDEDGNPIYREDGKVLKSKNWSPPKLGPILNEALKEETV